jgi:hypothetical protein
VFAYGYQERERIQQVIRQGQVKGKERERETGKRGAASEFGVAKIEQHCDGNVTMLTACW